MPNSAASIDDPQWPVWLLKEMVLRPSPSRKEKVLVEFLADEMRRAGWDVRIDEVGNFIGRRGAAPDGSRVVASQTLVFLGHVDTVAGAIPVREENGLLHGRGAVDAKGPLAAFLAAATLAQLPDGLEVVCIGAVEEETHTSKGARHVVDRYEPDLAIIGEPSGWDTLCIGYRGNCHLRLRIEQPRSHGASGIPSAGTRACEFWQAALSQAASQSQGEKLAQAVSVDVRSIEAENDGLTESAAMVLDVRTPPGFDATAFRRALESVKPTDAEIEWLEELPAVRGERKGPLVRAFLKAIRAEGAKPRYSFKSGTSDMNIVAPVWQCPILAYGPGDSSLDHTPEERIELAEFERSVRVLIGVLEGLR